MTEISSIVDYLYQYGFIEEENSNSTIEIFHNLVIKLINRNHNVKR